MFIAAKVMNYLKSINGSVKYIPCYVEHRTVRWGTFAAPIRLHNK